MIHREHIARGPGTPSWVRQRTIVPGAAPQVISRTDFDGRTSANEWPTWQEDNGVAHAAGIFVHGVLEGEHEGEPIVLDDVRSFDQPGDGLAIYRRARVRVLGGHYEGGRAGISITGSNGCGSDVEIHGAVTDKLDIEPDAGSIIPASARVLVSGVTLVGRRDLQIETRARHADITLGLISPSARTSIVESITPEDTALAGWRISVHGTSLGRCSITTPRAVRLRECRVEGESIVWQTQWRRWAPGVVRMDRCELAGEWRTVGYGTLVLNNCDGELVLNVASFAGYDPDEHPFVVVRDGVTHEVRKTGRVVL